LRKIRLTHHLLAVTTAEAQTNPRAGRCASEPALWRRLARLLAAPSFTGYRLHYLAHWPSAVHHLPETKVRL